MLVSKRFKRDKCRNVLKFDCYQQNYTELSALWYGARLGNF